MGAYIYAKDVLRARIGLVRETCFVIMPFKNDFDRIYAFINDMFEQIGFRCRRSDDLYARGEASGPILGTVVERIMSSHFILADLTGKNSNVFYELGIAHSCREPEEVILIAQSIEDVPFDLRQLNVVLYSPDNLKLLSAPLANHVTLHKTTFEGRARFIEHYKTKIARHEELITTVSFFEKRPNYWALLLSVLGAQAHPLRVAEQEELLFEFARDIQAVAGEPRLFDNLIGVFLDAISFTARESELVSTRIFETLRSRRFTFFKLRDDQTEDILILMAIRMFQQGAFKLAAFEFMLHYLSKPKIAGVDLKRGQIESFIYDQRDDREVHEWLISSLTSSSHHLREEIADLLGEMEVALSADRMISALRVEKNPYVARSIFNALGRIRACEGAAAIMEWLQANVGAIGSYNFLLTYARQAIKVIDIQCSTKFTDALANFVVIHSLRIDGASW